jgi:dynein heavy chain, axonemal
VTLTHYSADNGTMHATHPPHTRQMPPRTHPHARSTQAFRGEDITEQEIQKVEPILSDPEFTVENMRAKSAAAANLCTWVISIYTFNRIYVKVKPLMDSLEAARASKAAADESLRVSSEAVAAVEAKLKLLEDRCARVFT